MGDMVVSSLMYLLVRLLHCATYFKNGLEASISLKMPLEDSPGRGMSCYGMDHPRHSRDNIQ